MSLNGRWLGAILASTALAACSRPPLPAPALPLVTTPDEAFRASPPALPRELAVVGGLPQIQSATLSNGLTVWVVTRRRSPYLAMSVVTKDGGTWGASVPELMELTTRAIVEGGTVWADGRIVDPPALNGRTVEAWSTLTYSGLEMQMLKPALESGFDILTSTLRSPAFSRGNLDGARLAQLKQIQNRSASVSNALWELTVTSAFGKATAEHLLASRMDEVRRSDIQAIERCYHERFRPETSALIAVGDVTLQEIQSLAEPTLGTWHAPGTAALQAALETPPRKSSGRRIHFMLGDTNQARVLVLQPAPSYRERDDELPFALLAEIAVGSPFGSRANVSLRHAAGVTYGVRPSTVRARGLGLMGVEASFEVDETAPAIRELFSMLERLQRGEISADELERGKVGLAASFERDAQNNASFAELAAQMFAADQTPDWLGALPKAIAAVKPADLLRVARKYLQPNNVEVAVSGPPSLGQELMALGEVDVYTVERR